MKIEKSAWAEWLKSNGVEPEKIEQLEQISGRQNMNMPEVLVQSKAVPEESMIEFMSEELGIPTLNIQAIQIEPEILSMVPRKLIEQHRVMPIGKVGKLLTVATGDPFKLRVFDDLRRVSGCDIVPVLVPSVKISEVIDNYFAESRNFDEFIGGKDADNVEIVSEEAAEASRDAVQIGVEDAPVIKLVNFILEKAIKQRASDIHFEPYEKEFRVRYRIDGALRESFSHSLDFYPALVARIKIISKLDITEKRVPQDGRFRLILKDRQIDFRVSILPTYFGEKMVLRILDRSGIRSGLDKLGFSEKPTSRLIEAVKRPYGMILVTGPTGSGKSTTLYSILNSLNTPEKNLMTVEDPVEYQVEGITQTQVIPEIGLTFASGLRALLRQSPDIVLVGEIRDGETADIAVKAALTGHLVFSTLHTNSAAGAMTRLMDMGVEPFLIASSVVSVAAQRLLRRICPSCKAPATIHPDVLRRCKIPESDLRSITAYHGKGCAQCNNTGYLGRIGAAEVLSVDSEIRNLVIQKKSSNVIHEVAVQKGMETLFENALGLFKTGITTLEEVLRVTSAE
ncbi:MAG: Type II secretion system protein E [Candidatus Omnitrophica bacterium ADurb.Bin277]|nr:MAG: Type II secretion system protein E [Candidatus Omnitrophica bacterium ADurb.Bin277]